MQRISDIIIAELAPKFNFIDFHGFAQDIRWTRKKQGKEYVSIFPVGCNTDPDQCNDSELKYLLPEYNKTGIAFFDRLKKLRPIELECNNTEDLYSFDLVVWVSKRVNFENAEFCDKAELLFAHLEACLLDVDIVAEVGIRDAYKRSPWKWDDCVEFTQPPYIAFRIPLKVQLNDCIELTDLDVNISEC